ncbi:MAG: hypothetical protein ACPGUV_15025 [Polyangiales bacterium]
MQLIAVIGKEELREALEQITPLRIHLSPPEGFERWIELDPPKNLAFVPGDGVRFETSGRLRYETAVVPLGTEVRDVQVLLQPRVVRPKGQKKAKASPRLVFAVELSHGEIQAVPQFLDAGFLRIVNKALTPRASKLVWDFSDTLSNQAEMSPRLQPLEQVETVVEGGAVEVREDAIHFSVEISLSFSGTMPRRHQPIA